MSSVLRRILPKVRAKNVTDYYRRTNWVELWDDWYLKLSPNGMPFYKTLRQFVCARAKTHTIREFLRWYLGPVHPDKTTAEQWAKKYAFIPGLEPQDWKHKRDTHGWYTETNVRKFSLEIHRKTTALEKLATAGDAITLNSLARMEQLAQRLDAEFQGRFFVDGLDAKENVSRAKTYLRLHSQLLGMIERAQEIYAKSHGINFNDMQSFGSFVAAQITLNAAMGVGGDKPRSQVETLVGDLARMALTKAAQRNLPLPADVESKVIDVASESAEDQPVKAKKRTVQ